CLSQTFGKLQCQREPQQPRSDTSGHCNTATASGWQLKPATRGSLGVDLAAAVETIIMTTSPHKIATGKKGPITIHGKAVGALLLGRSSASMLGLFVLPGVIDADYMGEIMIMVYTLYPPVRIQKGQRIAQLVPLEQLTKAIAPVNEKDRGSGGFGSTGGLTLLTLDLNDRPKKTVVLEYQGQKKTLTGLLDTGADSSIIAPQCWLRTWPLQATATTVTGVGGMTLASRSPPLRVTIEGKTITSVFSVVHLPPIVQCLIGRDIMAQLGIIL
ncbi:POK9 protein, partial [Vireo altiloquus]|nr:POK9 protein [Vireo altiloquus]